MSKKYFYPVIFEPEEVGVSVYVPDIPGCNTQEILWKKLWRWCRK